MYDLQKPFPSTFVYRHPNLTSSSGWRRYLDLHFGLWNTKFLWHVYNQILIGETCEIYQVVTVGMAGSRVKNGERRNAKKNLFSGYIIGDRAVDAECEKGIENNRSQRMKSLVQRTDELWAVVKEGKTQK